MNKFECAGDVSTEERCHTVVLKDKRTRGGSKREENETKPHERREPSLSPPPPPLLPPLLPPPPLTLPYKTVIATGYFFDISQKLAPRLW